MPGPLLICTPSLLRHQIIVSDIFQILTKYEPMNTIAPKYLLQFLFLNPKKTKIKQCDDAQQFKPYGYTMLEV